MTCSEIFERMTEKFEEIKPRDIFGVFQFNVSGPGGGNWFAVCEGDSCRVQRGRFERPDVIVAVSADNAVKLAEKRLNPALALLTRKVKVQGDLGLIARIKDLVSK